MSSKTQSGKQVNHFLDDLPPSSPEGNFLSPRGYVSIFIPGKTRIYRPSHLERRDWAYDRDGPHAPFKVHGHTFVNHFEERR